MVRDLAYAKVCQRFSSKFWNLDVSKPPRTNYYADMAWLPVLEVRAAST